ncbi:sperm-specific H1/protamine-like protein type 2 [Octopus bimaculoides]|uniref:H15 domain-containing protein n=1 Tax=Octopus bimaculoides TaxID=37653 RepID=A0A0L8IFG9_OCTBM|nr:sperm-specific H1/protamine-like protein type 2 [Octopus bimaculoides]|eukprot:XP_014773013.1 PREDICTED: sperm-specific H1/protamine-like protein type 2 [Octopus bimaculoides]
MSKKLPPTNNFAKESNRKVKRPTYNEMIKEAILFLNERKGSSRQAISKYIEVTYNLSSDDKNVQTRLKMNLVRGVNEGYFQQISGKGANGSFKVIKEEQKSKAKTKPNKEVTSKESKPKNVTTKKLKKSPEKPEMSPTKSEEKPLPKLKIKSVSLKKSNSDASTPTSTKKLARLKGKLFNSGKAIKPTLLLLTPHKKRRKRLTKVLTPKRVVINAKSKKYIGNI